MMRLESVDQLRLMYAAKGYEFFENGDYNLNIFGVRSKDIHSNQFNDIIGIAFKSGGVWCLLQFDATTDPGLTFRLNPINENGVGVLAEGQHRRAYQLGTYKDYTALRQAKALPCYRDNDQNSTLDLNPEALETGWQGAHIHRASALRKSILVDRWSAMCQVVADPLEFDVLIGFCELSAEIYGNLFTYTLFNERDIASN